MMLIKLTVLILMTNVLYPQSTIPESIKDEVETALSYYPELKNTAINLNSKRI